MYTISPGISDDTDTMMVYRSEAPAMNMGTMLPQDGEDMTYNSGSHAQYGSGAYGHQNAATYAQRGYEGYDGYSEDSHYNSATPSVEYEDYGDESAESYEDSGEYYDEHASAPAPTYKVTESPLAIMPPIGDWYKSGSVEDKERELRRTIANRDNMMVFPLHTLFKIPDLGAREWKLSDVFKKAGEHSPYMYKGTPFHDDRTIKNIFLRDASQNSPVSLDITASLVHPSSNEETMIPITSFLSSGNEEGPSHLYLRPKESSDKEVLLWRKDYSRKIPHVVLENPGVTRRELTSGLNRHPNKLERKLRTLSRDHLLIRYVKEMIDMGMIAKTENPVEWRQYEGYGIIDAHRANTLIDRFIKDQSKVLSLRNIWDLRIKLSRGVQPIDGVEDAELISEVPVFSHEKASDAKSYVARLKSIPYNLHWSIQVELEPEIKSDRK